MKLLWLATKSPWPPQDGGRLVLLETLRALAAAGHEITLVAPSADDEVTRARAASDLAPFCRATLVPSRPPRAALFGAEPWTIRRHRRPEVRAAAARLAAAAAFDVVVAEQLQALAQAPVEARSPRPDAPRAALVLRAQNVESDLWRGAARLGGWRAPLLRREARRLERAEVEALRAVDLALALTGPDRDRLRQLGGAGARVEAIPAPFPADLPAGPALDGDPAVVLFGSAGWAPNRDQGRWFTGAVWPLVAAGLPAARLHLYGGEPAGGERITWHEAPADSQAAFARGATLVVPLRVGSGVRMKILEAWARGVPAVTTPAGAAGLVAEPGRELLVADSPEAMAAAIARLTRDRSLREGVIRAGREALEREHAPRRVASLWQDALAALVRR